LAPVSCSVPVLFLTRPTLPEPLAMTALMTRSFGFRLAALGFSGTSDPGCTSMVRVVPPSDRLPLIVAGTWLDRFTRSAMLPARVSVPGPVATLPPTRTRALVWPTPTVFEKPFRSSRPELFTVISAFCGSWLLASNRTTSPLVAPVPPTKSPMVTAPGTANPPVSLSRSTPALIVVVPV
jgi:hypothetical protein